MAVVYRHIRLDKNEPFYIGIGQEKRAYTTRERNEIWRRIVDKTDYEVEILFDDLTWEEAIKKEKEFISLYGRKNNNTGILANMTDGGEGSPNTIVSQKTRRLKSLQTRGGKNPKARKVYCKYLNKNFDTISECAEALGVSQPYLTRMINGERTNKYNVKIR